MDVRDGECAHRAFQHAGQVVDEPRIHACTFFEGGRGGTDQNGDRYVQMEVELYVVDPEGTRSASIRQPVRMYPNRMCGFSY